MPEYKDSEAATNAKELQKESLAAIPHRSETWQEMRDRIHRRYHDPLVNPRNTKSYGGFFRALAGEILSYALVYLLVPWAIDELLLRFIETTDCLSLGAIAWVKVFRYWAPYVVALKAMMGFAHRIFQGDDTNGDLDLKSVHKASANYEMQVTTGFQETTAIIETSGNLEATPSPIGGLEDFPSKSQCSEFAAQDCVLGHTVTSLSTCHTKDISVLAPTNTGESNVIFETDQQCDTIECSTAIAHDQEHKQCLEGLDATKIVLLPLDQQPRATPAPTPPSSPKLASSIAACWKEQRPPMIVAVPRINYIACTANDPPGRTFDRSQKLVTVGHSTIKICQPSHSNQVVREFQFPHVFDPLATNDDVCFFVREAIERVVSHGTRFSILADGYSGTGKSHTLFESNNSIARFTGDILFTKMKLDEIWFSATEVVHSKTRGIYTKPTNLALAKPFALGPVKRTILAFKAGTEAYSVSSATQLQTLIDYVVQGRETYPTASNQNSSRSHLICHMLVPVDNRYGMITLVDLAGAEDASVTEEGSISHLINQGRSEFNTQLLGYARNPTKAVFRTGELAKALRTAFPLRPLDTPAMVYLPHINQAQSTKCCSQPRLDMARKIMLAQEGAEKRRN
ncbi:hypothetical protein yc1106_02754 [Curvularia clavata]|uniref:Kinesin motor domain-containing protein n=1 Tax=Curvularia clavata TaxID=95742 RepID=A0A9Q8Z4E5_CURCL|nr:hypothetical protein yc1106_02754 [Curvularia clavata]